MKVSFDDNGYFFHYRVHDFDEKYRSILKMYFYEETETGYIKKYPKTAKYISKMMQRYNRHAQDMFDQLGHFKDVPWEKGLDSFCLMIKKTQIDWWLTGSCAACIRGIPLHPHDIDIMIDSKDVPDITDLFQNELIEPIIDTDGWVTKDFGVVFHHCRIDIASDPSPILDQPEPVDCGPYAKAHLETVKWKDHLIRIPPLSLQIKVNRKRGRLDRVKMMEKYMHT